MIEMELDGTVGVVTMAKPPHNLMDGVFLDAVIGAYRQAVDEGARAILLRSSMKHFCAGADVGGFGGGGEGAGGDMDAPTILDALESIPVPTIAAVHGAALGGGFELALTCDLIIASESAKFGLVETSLGLLPLLGGVQRVTERAGSARGKEIALFGRRHDPRTLERWNVLNLVVPDDELDEAARSWAHQLGNGPTVAYRGVKELANLTARDGIAPADAHQETANGAMWATEDVGRGLTAFAETGPGTATFEGS
ncbi:MAG: enoyl-CoA hydratase/isomerase family protein [Actinomycetota bacterium]